MSLLLPFRVLAGLVFALILVHPVRALPPLQLYVELTPPGGVLRPPPGRYSGPVSFSRPITLDGNGEVTLDGQGRGTVLSIEADGCVVRGMHLTDSGNSHNKVDAGILVTANDAVIEHNRLDDVLFGIHLKSSDGTRIRANSIRSKATDRLSRGDGIRLWNSHNNWIEDNLIEGIRDIFITNSSGNRIAGNRIRDSRFGLELVFSPENRILDNHISDSDTGILLLYSDDLLVRGNQLSHLRSISGAALAFKESRSVLVSENRILHCAVGVMANAPVHPENILTLRDNDFFYNDLALYFYGEKGGHLIVGNHFEQNLTDVSASAPSAALFNEWNGNRWDLYQGLDLNGDGIGDRPHEIHIYSDRLWMDRPMTRFFRGSPLLELVDFIERLAPFSAPRLLVRDPTPRMHPLE